MFIKKYENSGYVVDDIKAFRKTVQTKKILNALPDV